MEQEITSRRAELNGTIEQCLKLLREIDQQLKQARQLKQNFNLTRSNMEELRRRNMEEGKYFLPVFCTEYKIN